MGWDGMGWGTDLLDPLPSFLPSWLTITRDVAGHVDEEVPLSVVLLVTQLVLMAFVDPTGE